MMPSALQRIGRDVLAPAFCLHAHRTVEIARERELDLVLFKEPCAPLLRSIDAIVAGALGDTRPRRQLRASVSTVQLAGTRHFGPREARAAERDDFPTLLSLLARYQLLDPEILAYAEESMVDLAKPLQWSMQSGELQLLLDSHRFQSMVEERAATARAKLREELSEAGFFAAKRAGLVELGWAGRTRDQLEVAFPEGAPRLFGISWALVEGEGRGSEGTVFDWRRPATLAERSPQQFPLFFETVCRALPGPVEAVQAGIREGAEAYAAALRQGARRPLDAQLVDAQARIERFIHCPTGEEIRATRTVVPLESHHWHGVRYGRWRAATLPAGRPLRWLYHLYETIKIDRSS
jgi:hypothetical protein